VTSAPVVPKPAATVVLIRDDPSPPPGRTPLQVFLQRRVAGMAFAGGMTVFPGGSVDYGDHTDADRWEGPEPQWWAERFGLPPDEAAALVAAAVRETYEECGVLLADSSDVDARARDDLAARRRTLPQVLAEAGLVLRADLLMPWSRWVTPESEPRRYDTAFFVARLPDGQEADARTTEAIEATWWSPDDALAGGRSGELRLSPPTQHTLTEIAPFPDVDAVLDAARSREVRTYRPVLARDGGRLVVTDPGLPELRYDLGPA
jgi:8-oxo-dGTP pyrophosphatase MutT (NUDIX family)